MLGFGVSGFIYVDVGIVVGNDESVGVNSNIVNDIFM